MKYMSAAELRKKTKQLKVSLKKGDTTYLTHRSDVIGVVVPYSQYAQLSVREPVVATKKGLEKLAEFYATGNDYTYAEREEIYRKTLENKYGKDLS